MNYFFSRFFFLFLIFSFTTVSHVVIAQSDSLAIFDNIKPVTILDRASVFFTFNKEKKVQKLQDISKRYALSGVSVMTSGETEKGQKFLDQSVKRIQQAITTVSQIQDEQIGDRLIASLAYDVTEQSTLVEPLQKQDTQLLRTTAQNLLEHNTRLLQTLSDQSFEQSVKKIQEGDIIRAEKYLSLAESHTAQAFSVASLLEHENQKQLVGSILDMNYNRIENLSHVSKDSSDTRVQSILERTLRSTTSGLGDFSDTLLEKESLKEENNISIDSAFMILDSVVSLSKLSSPVIQQEILKTLEEKQKVRVDKNNTPPVDNLDDVRKKKDSFEEKILGKEIKLLLDTQSLGLESAIKNNIISEDILARTKDSRSRILDYGEKISIEKESDILNLLSDSLHDNIKTLATSRDILASNTSDTIISSDIEFISSLQDQKIKNLKTKASLGLVTEDAQNISQLLDVDNTALVDASLLIQDEIKKEQNSKDIKNKSDIRKKEIEDLSLEYKGSIGSILASLGEKENSFQSTLVDTIEKQKQEKEKKEVAEVEKPVSEVVTDIVASEINPSADTVSPLVDSKPSTSQNKPVVESPKKPIVPVAILPCIISHTVVPVENESIDIGSTVQFTELEIKTDGCNADVQSFNIVVSGSVAPLVSRKMSKTCVQPATSSFVYEPRIMYWWGKVNLHRDTDTGQWKTDPDGTSGANLDELTYCKKWYPKTVSVKDYGMEMSDAWRGAGNTGSNHIAITLDNIRLYDDKGILSVGPISTAQNRGVYNIKLPKPYRVTKNGARLKLSADIIGGKGLGVVLWLSDIMAMQENSEHILTSESQ